MKARAAAITFAAMTAAYVAVLAWLESRKNLSGLGEVAAALPGMLALTSVAWLARAARWQWLLRRAGHRLPTVRCAAAYLAGFAYTTTPGKLGELVRVRYFAALGVPPWKVLAAFVFERACDLIIVLLLAAAALHEPRLLLTSALFVSAVVACVLLLAMRPRMGRRVVDRLRQAGWRRSWKVARFLHHGLAGCRVWLRPLDLLVSAGLAVVAWGATSLALLWLLHAMGHALPFVDTFPIYPLAMLVGAASLLPGGIGTTEATIIGALARLGVEWAEGAVAALGVRLATLWCAVAVGVLSVALLELDPAVRSNDER